MGKIPDPANDDIDEAAELADGEQLLQDFNRGMDGVIRSMMRAQDQVIVEGAGLTERPFDEDAPLKLSDAVYLPILGGEVRRNGSRIASQTFTKRSLEGAIKAGQLEGQLIRGKWTVTVSALKAFVADSQKSQAKSEKPKPQPSFKTKTNRERERGLAAVALVQQMLSSKK